MKVTAKLKYGCKSLYIISNLNGDLGVLPFKSLLNFYDLHIKPEDLDNADYEKLLQEIKSYAKSRLFNYLSKHEKSVYDSKIFLKKLYLPYNVIDDLILLAQKYKFANDERFCDLYCENCYLKGLSKAETIFKLKQKKLDGALIQAAVSQYFSDEKYTQQIKNAVEKAKNRYEGEKNERQKIVNYLYRKGYKWHEIENYLDFDF